MRRDGERTALPSKVDNVKVRNGDQIVFRTAGGGGWGDPLERDPGRVRNDVARKLVGADAAREHYGVVLKGADIEVDGRATQELRESLKRNRKPLSTFDFGERPGGVGATGP